MSTRNSNRKIEDWSIEWGGKMVLFKECLSCPLPWLNQKFHDGEPTKIQCLWIHIVHLYLSLKPFPGAGNRRTLPKSEDKTYAIVEHCLVEGNEMFEKFENRYFCARLNVDWFLIWMVLLWCLLCANEKKFQPRIQYALFMTSKH